jgi:hypothetical protein
MQPAVETIEVNPGGAPTWLGPSQDPLAALAAAPTCAAAQADGVPCEGLARDCDGCPAFRQHRDRMRAREGPP